MSMNFDKLKTIAWPDELCLSEHRLFLFQFESIQWNNGCKGNMISTELLTLHGKKSPEYFLRIPVDRLKFTKSHKIGQEQETASH